MPRRDAEEPAPRAMKDDPLTLAAHPTTRIDGPIDGRDDPPLHGADLFPLPTSGVLPPESVESVLVSTDADPRLPAIVIRNAIASNQPKSSCIPAESDL